MDEVVFGAIEENAERAKQAGAAEAAFAAWQAEQKARKKAAARRADMAFFYRSALWILLLTGLMLAVDAHLVNPVLAGGILLWGFAYIGFHAGAWWRFRFGRKEWSE